MNLAFRSRISALPLLCWSLLACGEPDRSSDAMLEAGIVESDAGQGSLDAHTPSAEGGSAHDATVVGDSAPAVICSSASGADQDGDKFLVGAGDCNDCDRNVNPGAFDVPDNGIDEDCSNIPDDEPLSCDQGLPLAGDDASDAARSLGLCRKQQGASWGIKSARWVFPDGSTGSIDKEFCPVGRPPFPLGRGILPAYGTRLTPRDGKSMVALSTGVARVGSMELGPELSPASGQAPDEVLQCTPSMPPAGFPTWTTSCGGTAPSGVPYIFDAVALELEIKVPSNASELSFDFDFISAEFPAFVCDGKSDHFVALLYSSHTATPANHNISFDSKGAVVSVDGAFVRVCEPTTFAGRAFDCPLGISELEGTFLNVRKRSDKGEFMQGGATSWLTTRAPVVPGEVIKVRFAIWDSDDTLNDSTVLIDHLRFNVVSGDAPSPPLMTPTTIPIVLL